MKCPIHAVTGLLCPGCGGTRSFRALLQGRVLLAVHENPVPLLLAAAAVLRYIEGILKAIRSGDRVIAMAIGGREYDSPGLAEHIRKLRDGGAGRIVFVIGGSLGIGKNVMERADETVSMGRMTFPHQLARVMLLEQLYRAEKINAGERYHK